MAKKATRTHDGHGYHVTAKGYPRFNTCGPRKGEYIHRYEAAKKLGRALTKDEMVHHHNGDKADFSHDNLVILGEEVHGWVSARQAWFMRYLDIKTEAAFNAYFEADTKGGNVACDVTV
jgi:hypothetical protein